MVAKWGSVISRTFMSIRGITSLWHSVLIVEHVFLSVKSTFFVSCEHSTQTGLTPINSNNKTTINALLIYLEMCCTWWMSYAILHSKRENSMLPFSSDSKDMWEDLQYDPSEKPSEGYQYNEPKVSNLFYWGIQQPCSEVLSQESSLLHWSTLQVCKCALSSITSVVRFIFKLSLTSLLTPIEYFTWILVSDFFSLLSITMRMLTGPKQLTQMEIHAATLAIPQNGRVATAVLWS